MSTERNRGMCRAALPEYRRPAAGRPSLADLAQELVELGIESMSLNPDTILKTTKSVLEVEKRLGRRPRTNLN